MLRRIWHRAAALALPITLAICLPPLAVIAFNLHAQSAGPAHPVAPVHSKAPKLEKHSRSRGLRATRGLAPAARQDQVATNRE
jgi:hypothetical protein